jgi:hypothetical protein
MASMNKILDASRSMSSLDPYESTSNIVGECCRILNCDRATMFSLDTITQELLLWVAEGANNIRVPVGQGIAGTVAATGETINIVDAYGDPRFSSSYDKATGYKTNTILCMPIRSLDGGIAGVLQAINKNDGIFSSTDEEVMNMLCMQAGVALQNANHFFRAERSQNRFRALLDLIKAVQGEVGASSLIFTITQRTTKIAEADRCTLYLADNVSKGVKSNHKRWFIFYENLFLLLYFRCSYSLCRAKLTFESQWTLESLVLSPLLELFRTLKMHMKVHFLMRYEMKKLISLLL